MVGRLYDQLDLVPRAGFCPGGELLPQNVHSFNPIGSHFSMQFLVESYMKTANIHPQ